MPDQDKTRTRALAANSSTDAAIAALLAACQAELVTALRAALGG
jgi:hypothetical protein